MKRIIGFWLVGRRLTITSAWVGACALLFSFSLMPGAHSVQVYLDSKLVVDQYINSKMDAPKVWLDPAEDYSQLVVKYSECGRTVTGRTITIKDEKDKTLQEWHFEGATSGYKESMSCKVKDILALKQKGSNALKVYYSSTEFPTGQLVAHLFLSAEQKASR